MRYFKVDNTFYRPKITVVEVERETDEYVWINGMRNAKRSNYACYFKTFDEAKSFLVQKFEDKIINIKGDLQTKEATLSEIHALTEIDITFTLM